MISPPCSLRIVIFLQFLCLIQYATALPTITPSKPTNLTVPIGTRNIQARSQDLYPRIVLSNRLQTADDTMENDHACAAPRASDVQFLFSDIEGPCTRVEFRANFRGSKKPFGLLSYRSVARPAELRVGDLRASDGRFKIQWAGTVIQCHLELSRNPPKPSDPLSPFLDLSSHFTFQAGESYLSPCGYQHDAVRVVCGGSPEEGSGVGSDCAAPFVPPVLEEKCK